MYKFILTITTIVFSCSIYAQDNSLKEVELDSVYTTFRMINSADTNKTFLLKDNSSYTLTYVEYPKDGVTLEKIYYVNGNINDLYANKLDFDVINESIEHNFIDSSVINTQNDYSSFYYTKAATPRSINLNDLKYVNYSSPFRSAVNLTGKGTIIVSAAMILVVAPLWNMSFKKGTMNPVGYVNTAKIGLVGLAIGIPMSYFTKVKQYAFTDNKIKNDKDFWYLVKEE